MEWLEAVDERDAIQFHQAIENREKSVTELVAERIPEGERRFMTEIPLAASGPWDAAEREAMRVGLAVAEFRLREASGPR